MSIAKKNKHVPIIESRRFIDNPLAWPPAFTTVEWITWMNFLRREIRGNCHNRDRNRAYVASHGICTSPICQSRCFLPDTSEETHITKHMGKRHAKWKIIWEKSTCRDTRYCTRPRVLSKGSEPINPDGLTVRFLNCPLRRFHCLRVSVFKSYKFPSIVKKGNCPLIWATLSRLIRDC